MTKKQSRVRINLTGKSTTPKDQQTPKPQSRVRINLTGKRGN